MRPRRHELVDHGIGTPTAVVGFRHLLTGLMAQPIGRPRLTLGNVVAHGVFQRIEAATISLCASFHVEVVAPINIGVGEAFLHQLGLEVLEVVAGALDFFLEIVRDGNNWVIIERTAH